MDTLRVRDPSMFGRTDLLERIAKHSLRVVIRGETGTGKKLLARTLHTLSRRSGELVTVDGATLARVEGFGNGSVLFDEVGELSLELQAKLVHILEIVGGVPRVFAASQHSLPELVARGEFREDLYFRLDGITLELAPLRERRDAIPALANKFLVEIAQENAQSHACFTQAALSALTSYDWPGNVRELRLVVARAALLAGDSSIDVQHLLLRSPRGATGTMRADFAAIAREHQGNASAISRVLNTSRTHVRRLAARYGIDLEALRR